MYINFYSLCVMSIYVADSISISKYLYLCVSLPETRMMITNVFFPHIVWHDRCLVVVSGEEYDRGGPVRVKFCSPIKRALDIAILIPDTPCWIYRIADGIVFDDSFFNAPIYQSVGCGV